MNFFGGGSNRN
jgi:ubiquitin fusion degradation protein 1